ncbi:hypothetical protein OF385_11125 [Glutamicibacter sp. JL.03c]|uniref:hypothetical protein n=1 Tax=Glutamicibacter sp. JL.03c TaxID=2984842 RepID=UPI0021F6BF58|nr:hypothetical protein [Glutamicibacter sp. JL.03c]UYQ76583.1 hypothetical protein OF385_11125 [Glutamicibacter sp. JL.03c]
MERPLLEDVYIISTYAAIGTEPASEEPPLTCATIVSQRGIPGGLFEINAVAPLAID